MKALIPFLFFIPYVATVVVCFVQIFKAMKTPKLRIYEVNIYTVDGRELLYNTRLYVYSDKELIDKAKRVATQVSYANRIMKLNIEFEEVTK